MIEEQDQQTDAGVPGAIERPTQYPTATKIDNGIAYDVSGKPLGPVDGQAAAPDQQKDDSFFAKLGGKQVQAETPAKGDDFFASLGGKTVQQTPAGPTAPTAPGETPGASQITGIRARDTGHVSGGKDMFGRETEASPTAARQQWADWFNDLKGDLDNGTDATWVGWLLRKAGAKGLTYGNSPEVGHMIGGPLYGPAMVGHGLNIAQEHPVQGANEIISGVGTALGPLAVTQPEALPFMAIAGSTSKGVSYAAQQLGADPETAELIGNVVGLASAGKMMGKAHLLDKFESSTNDYMAAQKDFTARLGERSRADSQALKAESDAVAARRAHSNGQTTDQQLIAAEENASAARANSSKSQKAFQQASELRDQSGVKMRQIARQIQGTRNIQKMDIRRAKEVVGAHEDYRSMAPPTASGPAHYDDSDLHIARTYVENAHTKAPIDSVQGQHEALEAASKSIDAQIDPYIKKYAAEPISGNVKMYVADALAEQDKTTPGFLNAGLKALSKYDITDLSMEEADKLRETLNAENRSIMSKHFPGSIELATKLKTDPEFAANYHAMEALRQGIDGNLQDHGIDGIRPLRRDQASIIRVKNAVERQLTRGDQVVRGSGRSGPMRQAASWTAEKGATTAGAKFGPKGAFVGSIVGKKLGELISPGDITKNQLASRTMEVKGAGRPLNTMVGGEGTPATRPGFETPPVPSNAMLPEDVQKIQRELSPLHGELATHYGEHVLDAPYEELEQRFMEDVSDKREHGISLEPDEKTLLGKISQQNAADALAAQKAAQEAEVKGDGIPKATLPENAQALLPVPEDVPHKMTPQMVVGHELAHAIVADKNGIVIDEIRSHNHPSNQKNGNFASAKVDWEASGLLTSEGGLDVNKLKTRMPGLAATYVAGGVANDLYHNIPFKENLSLGSDIKALQELLDEVGFSKTEQARIITQAADDAAQILSQPGMQELIESHSEVREPGLSDRLHVSPDRMQQIYKDAKGGANETGDITGTSGTVRRGTENTGTGRKGQAEAGNAEVVRQESEGSSEGKAAGTKSAAESASAEPGKPGATELEHPAVSAVTQGGHAGGGVASEEELARPGRFVKISRSGMPTDQGKTPDFNLGAGEAGYQVRPGGQYELKAGQETPATRRGVEGYARQAFPESPALSAGKPRLSDIIPELKKTPELEKQIKDLGFEGVLQKEWMRQHQEKSQPITERLPKIDNLRVPPERTTGEYDAAIKQGGAVPGGIQKGDPEINLPDLALFHDPTTGSTLALPVDQITPENVKTQLNKSRDMYIAAEDRKAAAQKLPENPAISQIKPESEMEYLRRAPARGELDVAAHADEFNRSQGKPEIDATPKQHNPEFASRVADAYDAMKHDPNDPKVAAAYNAMKNDVRDQWDYATKQMGIKFEPWNKEGQPYKNSKEMTDDVKNNKHLYFFQGGELPVDHPLATVDPTTGHSYNDMLRAVHDLFGHAAHEFQFGPKGEENAYLVHRQMFSPEAIPALTSETRGQNSWVNFGKHLQNSEGKIPAKGETGYVPPSSRPFAENKAGVLPEEFHTATPGQHWSEQITQKPFGGVNPNNPDAPSKTYGFEIAPEHRYNPPALTADEAKQYAERAEVKAALAAHPDVKLGWDTTTNGPELNIGASTDDLETAKKIAGKLDQRAIVNTKTGDEIPAGGKGEKTSFPEYPIEKRLEDLNPALSPKGSTVPLMDNPLKVKGTGEGKQITTVDIAKELKKFTNKQLPALELGKAEPKQQIERAKAIAEDEARYQLAQNNTGAAWYTTDMAKHDQVIQQMRPELNNPAKMSLFKMAEAILSSGQRPTGNVKAALRAWDDYQETGKFSPTNPDTRQSWGPRGVKAYGNAMEMLNRLIAEKGEQGTSDWLLTEHPIRELRQYNTSSTGGGGGGVAGKADDMLPGAYILGRKRGPFAQNLHGQESAFTADMWVSRSWNRWMGTTEIAPDGEISTDSPRSGKEQSLMKQSFQETADKLNMSTSSLQAALWYYEKHLYDLHGAKVSDNWSFSDAAQRASDDEASSFKFGANAPGKK